MNHQIITLDDPTFAVALQELSANDADLAHLLNTLGEPPRWFRDPGFATLLYIILEQQVSLQSAKALYTRLEATVDPLTPENFLTLDSTLLREIGFSRQKTAYSQNLAQKLVDGELDLAALATLDDETVLKQLTALKGIGPWTANIYLLEALRRPDIWPSGDLALAVAVQEIKGLEQRPTPKELDELGEVWRPWRSVAAHLFWHSYLVKRRNKGG